MGTVTSILPEGIKKYLRHARNMMKVLPLRFGNKRYCPVCEQSSGRFAKFGDTSREDAQCPRCGALERHRFLWFYLKKSTNLFDGTARRMLHVAPEACFESKLKTLLGGNYVTADLFDPQAMVKMDIMNIEYPDEAFDVIVCSHVLEHVQDDRKAMEEFCRVLAKGGWAILNVPITAEQTFEDGSIFDPQERKEQFGHEDHVRSYGPDYADRLREAGLEVNVVTVNDLVKPDEAIRMGLTSESGELFFCHKVPTEC